MLFTINICAYSTVFYMLSGIEKKALLLRNGCIPDEEYLDITFVLSSDFEDISKLEAILLVRSEKDILKFIKSVSSSDGEVIDQAILMAMARGNIEIIQQLKLLKKVNLQQHSKIIATDSKGNNLVHIAVQTRGYEELTTLLESMNNFREYLLLENDEGKTPLDIAAECNDFNFLSLFLDHLGFPNHTERMITERLKRYFNTAPQCNDAYQCFFRLSSSEKKRLKKRSSALSVYFRQTNNGVYIDSIIFPAILELINKDFPLEYLLADKNNIISMLVENTFKKNLTSISLFSLLHIIYLKMIYLHQRGIISTDILIFNIVNLLKCFNMAPELECDKVDHFEYNLTKKLANVISSLCESIHDELGAIINSVNEIPGDDEIQRRKTMESSSGRNNDFSKTMKNLWLVVSGLKKTKRTSLGNKQINRHTFLI